MTNLARLRAALDPHGLRVRGAFVPGPGDDVPPVRDGVAAAALLLVGNVGSSMWESFSRSQEYHDAAPEPLDRWSHRIGADIAQRLDALVLFPFGGPPHHPFQRWAARAGPLHPSPLGLLIDPRHGLWHAYRFALAMAQPPSRLDIPAAVASPCLGCAGRPCLRACPVDAFRVGGFRADPCVTHLSQARGSECMNHGCLARRACPVGAPDRYRPDHARFHMAAFVAAPPLRR